jgi:hypothetical protein
MTTTIIQSATWKEFQADNSTLTVKELQDSWSNLQRERQTAMAARYDEAKGTVVFKVAGRIALKGNTKKGIQAGSVQLAAIKRVTATKRELERQRHADAKRAAKTESGYAQLIAEASAE